MGDMTQHVWRPCDNDMVPWVEHWTGTQIMALFSSHGITRNQINQK